MHSSLPTLQRKRLGKTIRVPLAKRLYPNLLLAFISVQFNQVESANWMFQRLEHSVSDKCYRVTRLGNFRNFGPLLKAYNDFFKVEITQK